MKLKMAGKMAFSAVLSNKMRSFLTMLGIIIGVMAVTLLISLVQGATNSVTGQLDELGSDQVVAQLRSSTRRMTLHEVQELEQLNEVAAVSPVLNGQGTARADGNSADVSIVGITDRYSQVQGLDLALGRHFTRTDVDFRLSLAIVGSDAALDLFGTSDVLNRSLRLNGKDYRIVGVLESEEETLMGSTNDSIFIPYTNAQRLLSTVSVTTFYASAAPGIESSEAAASLKAKLKEKFGEEDSYSVVNMNDIMDIIQSVMGTLELLLGAIAGISLVVGGIGIMNIMLVSVTERTREIGIRKAIGAQRSDIIVQFLIESIIISLLGGLIGMAVSWGILSVLNANYPDYQFGITTQVAIIALGFSIFVGIVFGIYPAYKAARLKPINALRYE